MTVPSSAVIAVCAVLGLLVGSFLNVVIWRVPRGESVVSPPSHCPGCDAEIAPRDNVPVVSWVLLRGRCRHCGEPISGRYPAVELLTGALFAAIAAKLGWHIALVGFLYFAAIAVALAFIDYDTKRLPNVLTLPSYVVGAVVLVADGAVTSRWSPVVHALIGGVALWLFYFLLVLIYPSGMGWGDVKLAGVIGVFVGWLGYGPLIVAAFAGFLFGGIWGIALIAAKRIGMKSAVPYGPFMLAGAMVAIFAGHPLAAAYVGALH